MPNPLDLITVGESMLRLSVPAGSLLAESQTFEAQIAGAESNVAVGVARMGYRARWLSRLTDNTIGRRIVHELASYGVDCGRVVWTPDDRVGTYYLEIGAAPRPTTVIYDRAHTAASKMTPDTFDLAQIADARILHLTGITAALSEGCYQLVVALLDQAKKDRVHVVFDVNFRALLWSAGDCAAKLTPLLNQIDTLLIGRHDAEIVFGMRGEPPDMLRAFRDRFGIRQIAMTLAEAGAIGLHNDDLCEAAGYPTQIIDRIGAGDAFAAGVICGLLEGDFPLGLRYGTAMSALQMGLHGDLFRLGAADVKRLMESGVQSRPIR